MVNLLLTATHVVVCTLLPSLLLAQYLLQVEIGPLMLALVSPVHHCLLKAHKNWHPLCLPTTATLTNYDYDYSHKLRQTTLTNSHKLTNYSQKLTNSQKLTKTHKLTNSQTHKLTKTHKLSQTTLTNYDYSHKLQTTLKRYRLRTLTVTLYVHVHTLTS